MLRTLMRAMDSSLVSIYSHYLSVDPFWITEKLVEILVTLWTTCKDDKKLSLTYHLLTMALSNSVHPGTVPYDLSAGTSGLSSTLYISLDTSDDLSFVC